MDEPAVDQIAHDARTHGLPIPVEMLEDAGWEIPEGVTEARILRVGSKACVWMGEQTASPCEVMAVP